MGNHSNAENTHKAPETSTIPLSYVNVENMEKLNIKEWNREALEELFSDYDKFGQYDDSLSVKEFLIQTFLANNILAKHEMDCGEAVEKFHIPLVSELPKTTLVY